MTSSSTAYRTIATARPRPWTANRAVTVIGAGGSGKTQCALEVGRACAAEFMDGVWFFDLAPFERLQEWLRALALRPARRGPREIGFMRVW